MQYLRGFQICVRNGRFWHRVAGDSVSFQMVDQPDTVARTIVRASLKASKPVYELRPATLSLASSLPGVRTRFGYCARNTSPSPKLPRQFRYEWPPLNF